MSPVQTKENKMIEDELKLEAELTALKAARKDAAKAASDLEEKQKVNAEKRRVDAVLVEILGPDG
jgi:hypothetical protein